MPIDLQLPVYILAGGMSSRYGTDKARVELQGEPLLARIARLASPIASSITAIAKTDGSYADLGVRTIADSYQNAGPLAGIHAALSDMKTASSNDVRKEWILVLSCDLVHFDRVWIENLASCRTESSSAIAFRHTKWEPLLGLYRLDILQSLEFHLENGRHSPQKFLDDQNACAVSLPKNWPSIVQVNTPDDLRRFQSSN